VTTAYVAMTLMKFEEMGIEVNGEPVEIRPANLLGFMPVFASIEDAEAAGWDAESLYEVTIGGE